MATPAPKAKLTKLNLLCPECETETVLTIDDDGDYDGRCPECKLNVGAIYNKRRYQRAADALAEREAKVKEKEEKEKKKESSWI